MKNKTVKFTITNRCKIGTPTTSAITFSTRSGVRRIFNLPHSQIIKWSVSEIKQNDVHSEPATEYQVTPWIFGKIKEELESMKEFDVIISEIN